MATPAKTEVGDSVCNVGLARKMGVVALPNQKDGKVMHPDLINEHVKSAQYAVRGELYLRGQELIKEGKEIIFTNGEHFSAVVLTDCGCIWQLAILRHLGQSP